MTPDAACEGKCVATAARQGMCVGWGKIELPAYEVPFSGKVGCGTSLLYGELGEEDEEVGTDAVLTNASDDEDELKDLRTAFHKISFLKLMNQA